MRILHTSDWHLGHSLHKVTRDYEHECFLAWLLDTLEGEAADALLIAGDIFDSANPPATALATFYRFLADARHRMPRLDIVVVAGNHDSPARLEAPGPLMEAIGVHVVGTVSRGPDGAVDADSLLFPLHDHCGAIKAWCAAVPFLRPADLPLVTVETETVDPLLEGVRQLYAVVVDTARHRLEPGQALLAMGHCYLVGTQVSELSERKILGGNQHALPADIFPANVSYAALGHLHRPQPLDGGRLRYSGSPLPLSFAEEGYPHQVVRVDFVDGHFTEAKALLVPRTVALLRLPAAGPRPLEEVVRELREYPWDEQLSPAVHPFLEVSVLLPSPEPGLRRRLEEVLEGRPVRLLNIVPHTPGDAGALADTLPELRLDSIAPDVVFSRRYHQIHDTDPPPPLMEAFHELLETVHQQDVP
ncbi:Nuclease SbcCD subunit D [Gammaproteobacteria bacterium]